MPWLPELFTAPALQRILDERRRDALLAVPYFDGLMAGDPDPLVESFAGEPEVHDPVRGRVKGVAAFRSFATDTGVWLHEHGATVEDVGHVILDGRGFEEVVLHLRTDRGPVELPVAVVADRRPDGRIEELRVYFASRPLTGALVQRPPLLQPAADLSVPAPVAAYLRALAEDGGLPVEPCARVDDGRTCAVEYNAVQRGTVLPSAQAGLAVFVRGASEGLAAVRCYDETARRSQPWNDE